MTVQTTQFQAYAGDISSAEAWKILQDDAASVLVDVRTQAEWSFVGVPDLSGLDKSANFIEWQRFPTMAVNAEFGDEVAAAGVTSEQTVLLICRSGARSAHAAAALTTLGFANCFNVADGFEGPVDPDGHRGKAAGWKAAELPWRQA